jgi:two-component system chemotaxis family response regulator WspR
MIDVDNFKSYNDTYGHLMGDEVLKSVATAMQASFLRPTDLAARFGGEEFVVILPATPAAAVQALGEKVRRNVEALQIPHSGSTSGAFLTISIGCASTIPQRGDSFVPLLATADAALYEAKESGKNRVVVRDHDRDKDHPPGAAGPAPTGESPS